MGNSPSAEEFAAAAGLFTPAPPMASVAAPGMPLAPPPGAPGVQQGPTMAELAASNFTGPPPVEDLPPDNPPFGPPTPPFRMSPQEDSPFAPSAAYAPETAGRKPVSFVRDPKLAMPAGAGGGLGKLEKARDSDRARMLGTYDAEAKANAAEADAAMAKNTALATMQREQAQHQQDEAEVAHHEAQQVQETHSAYIAKTNQMLDDLARQKVDPNHIFNSGNVGKDFTFAIGALLMAGIGGLTQRPGEENPGIVAFNRIVDRDIAAQDKNLANARTAIQARESVYGQMRQTYGDKLAADSAFRAAAMETAKTRLAALVSDSSNPELKAKAERVGALIDREQATHMATFSQQALSVAQQQAAASANAMRTRLKEEREYQLKVAELGVKQVEAGAKLKEAEGKAGEQTGKQTADYAQQLEKAGLPKAEAEIDALKSRLPKPGQDIPGFTDNAKLRKWHASTALFPSVAERILTSPEERINTNNVKQLALAYRNAVTGSGGSEAEMKQIDEAFLGAGSKEELWAAIAKADDIVAARKANLQAGYGPDVTSRYEQNLRGSTRPPLTDIRPGAAGTKK